MGCNQCNNMYISAALALTYFAYPSQWTKILPILFNAYNCNDDSYGTTISYGLAFSALGDISLEISSTDPLYFMAGLVFFLIGHVFYIKGKRRYAKYLKWTPN